MSMYLTSHNPSCPHPSSATQLQCPSAPLVVPSVDMTTLQILSLLNTNPNSLFVSLTPLQHCCAPKDPHAHIVLQNEDFFGTI